MDGSDADKPAVDRRTHERRSGQDRRKDARWSDVPIGTGAGASDELTDAAALEALLVDAARAVRERAHAPYSGFKVGAALQAADGDIAIGCNVENATYGLTMCAERTAIFRAIADGHREFARVVIVADTDTPTPPCGSCRQLLWEFCGDIEVVLANLERVTARYTMAELLPVPFDDKFLKPGA